MTSTQHVPNKRQDLRQETAAACWVPHVNGVDLVEWELPSAFLAVRADVGEGQAIGDLRVDVGVNETATAIV